MIDENKVPIKKFTLLILQLAEETAIREANTITEKSNTLNRQYNFYMI